MYSHIYLSSEFALQPRDGLQQTRGSRLAEVWSPASGEPVGHDVKRGHLLIRERLADLAAGAVLGVVFVLVSLGVGITCRLFLRRNRSVVSSSATEADAHVEVEALLPECSYTDLETTPIPERQRLTEESQRQKRKL
jgi:hypothetical protein